MRPLTERDLDTLAELAAANDSHTRIGYRDGWARVMDCGGSDSSHHSYTLTKLAKRGLAHVRSPSAKHAGRSCYPRMGKDYKISETGLAELAKHDEYESTLRWLSKTDQERDADRSIRARHEGGAE